jgi:ATP-binding cassette subfamily B protein
MKSKLEKTLVRQHDQFDCGVACLASVIKYHGGTPRLEALRQLSGTSTDGTTLLGLCEAAQQIGFEAEGLEAESVENLKEIKEPVILHVLIDKKLQHYVVFYGFDKSEKLIIGDPATGIRSYTKGELDEIWESKLLLHLKPNRSFINSKSERQQRNSWIYNLLKDDLTILIAVIFLGIVTSILGLSTAIFSQKLIDVILPSANVGNFIKSMILVFVLLLARNGISYLRNNFVIKQSADFSNRVLLWFYSRLIRLPKVFFDTRKVGELIARMNDTRRIQNSISIVTGTLIVDVLLVFVTTIFIFSYSIFLGVVVITSFPLYFLLVYLFNRKIGYSQQNVMKSFALTESHYIDSIQGIATIKLFNRESDFERVNKTVYGHFQNEILQLGKLNISFSFLAETLGTLFIIGFFFAASWQVFFDSLLIGEMVALLSMAGGIIPAINRIVVANFQIQESRVTFERMFEFTSNKSEDELFPLHLNNISENNIRNESQYDHVCINEVSFRFPGRRQILRNISFEIYSGKFIVLLGESGSGKSTLLNILQKFYLPEHGQITINNIDYLSIPASDWRTKLGVIPQEVKIFNGSLLYNLTLSNDIDENEIAIKFCNKFGFDKYFNYLPQGYMTIIGEEGINLSGGQKQLIAFARALFRKPKILLLDEPTAAMDRNTESFVMDLLLSLRNEVAILLITHKVITAVKADEILIIEDGTITAKGTASELLKSDNFFSLSYREYLSLNTPHTLSKPPVPTR